MRSRKKLPVALAVIAAFSACAIYADVFHIYTLRDDNGGTILWNSTEAYLFMSEVQRGYRQSWPAYGVAALFEWFNAPSPPSDQHILLTVIHVTPTALERHVVNVEGGTANVPAFLTPIEGDIYANCGGILCRWAGDRFENASEDEERRIGGIYKLAGDVDQSINGWSERGVGKVAGDSQFSVQIGKNTTLKVHQGDVYRSVTDSPTVELYRAGKPTQDLWRVNGDPHRVGKREYDRALAVAGAH